jgi:predicted TIM-barrel fold metal-dependent hydrolase
MLADKCVEDSDLDGVDVNVFFPSVVIRLYDLIDPMLTAAVFRAYNDWLADFCSYDSRRLKGVAALILPDDVDAAVRELERCVERGFVGGMIPMLSGPDPTYDDAIYDRLWAAAVEMGVPLMMHTGGIRKVAGREAPIDITRINNSRPQGGSDVMPRDNLIAMVYGGVFERFPELQVGVMEMGTGWIPYFVRSLDRSYLVRRDTAPRPKEFGDGMAPSDFIRRNVFFGYQDEDLGVLFRDIIGVDNLLYANDYPHPDCVWPRSRQVLESIYQTAGCTQEEKAKLAGGNAARIFGLKPA